MSFDPTSVEVKYVTLPKDHCTKSHENMSKYVDTVTGGITGRWAECPPPPETSDREISADQLGKKRQGKQGENWEEKWKILKGKVENWKWKVEKLQNE